MNSQMITKINDYNFMQKLNESNDEDDNSGERTDADRMSEQYEISREQYQRER